MNTQPAFGKAIRHLWGLDPEAVFLNNGSFGAAPLHILSAQQREQSRMERQPVTYFLDYAPAAIRRNAAALARFTGAEAQDLVFVENASSGVSAVVQSWLLHLAAGTGSLAGKEILTTSHAYGSVLQTLRHWCNHFRMNLRIVELPMPITGTDEIVSAVRACLSKNTVLAVFDHVTSSSGLIFPAQQLCTLCREHEIPVLIDGAHAPGMLPLHLDSFGADWYVGNCHKWMFAPKACALLWTSPRRQSITHPTVIAHKYMRGYCEEFDFVGTRDISPWLCVQDCIAFMEQLDVDAMRDYQKILAVHTRRMLADFLQEPVPAPESMLAALAAIALPGVWPDFFSAGNYLRAIVWRRFKIEVPFFPLHGRMYIRISAQVFNEPEDYNRLRDILHPESLQALRNELIECGNLLQTGREN